MPIDHQSPHIITVKSSAGAGKTYNLALRYLQLLALPSPSGTNALKSRICNIVAITFTNKAAAEMRSRITDWMKRIILDIPFKGSTLTPIDQILGDGADPRVRADLMRTVEEDFENLVRNFYDFKVGTIDSFVNLTLKASAFKLGLPPDFEISLDSALYVDAVLQECLQEILEDREVKRRFDDFLWAYLEIEGENAAWAPARFLTETVYRFWKEETKENKEFLSGPGLDHVIDLGREIARDAEGLLALLTEADGLKVRKDFLNALENLSGLTRTDFKGSACYKRPTLAGSLNKGSAPADEAWEEAWTGIRGLIASYVEGLAETKFSSYLEVYSLFKDRLRREVTFRQRLILIEELNKLLQDVICGEHFIPEIYYALAERYSHFLIDEFQDTNHLQWKNIGILADEALSRGGTLFVVGDKKQAIYRWRGGKAELVDEISSSYPSYPVHPVCLDINYRSGEHVIAFNNALFDRDNMTRLLGSVANGDMPGDWSRIVETYEGSGQQCLAAKKKAGYVYVERVDGESGDGQLSKDERERLIAGKVGDIVREIRERGVYEDREIAVLVRRRHEAELVVKKLLEAGVSVDSEFTVNVKNNVLVRETIGFLQFLSAPHDDAALAGFLTGALFSGLCAIDPKEIMLWITRQRLSVEVRILLYRAFQRDFPLPWEEYFAPFFKSAGYLPLYELFVLSLKRWAVLERFPEEAPYFLHLCEMIKKREGLGSNNLTGFLQFWKGAAGSAFGDTREDDGPFLLKTTEGANAVKVLTVHKAKGLQFGVVILPFLKLASFGAADRRDKGKFFTAGAEGLRLLHIKKEYAEYSPRLKEVYLEKETEYLVDEINNAYVACTRAEKELYIILADSDRQKNYLIDYVFSMEEFADYRSQSAIEIGSKREREGIRPAMDEGPATPEICKPDLSIFGRTLAADSTGKGGEIRWMEKVRAKFEPPEGCSRDQVRAKRKGDVIHYILSLITFLPPEADAFLVDACRRGAMRFGLNEHEEEIRRFITRFFRHEPFRRFFLPGEEETLVYTEKELTDRRGDAYKADRIMICGGFVDVIDFKTGETRSAAHRSQIANYGRLLQEIHPEKTVRKYLLYIDENKVEAL
ncbi:MAG TPA: UvrD-helicase domain-containing protein [Syntrophorhabdaceae bacterium]